jgi:predicted dehydrogenase
MTNHAAHSVVTASVRFGVCGTGYWAEEIHLPTLGAMKEVSLVGVWGRDSTRAATLARQLGIRAFDNADSLFDAVEAVSFVVPPDVQAELAVRAARAGKHLMLEKPIAATSAQADRLVHAVEASGVASLVFMTRQFVDEINAFIDIAAAARPAYCTASFRSRALLPGSPYQSSPWRHEPYGILLDAAPHPVAALVLMLGPIADVFALKTGLARYELHCRHDNDARSELLIDYMDESVPGPTETYVVEGPFGTMTGGPFTFSRQECFTRAVRRLIQGIHGADVRPGVDDGRNVVRVLDAAKRSIKDGGTVQEVGAPRRL